MNISLPADLKHGVDERVTNHGYGSASEYVRELIRRDLGRARLREMLLEGAQSPIAATVDDQFFADLRAKLGNSPRSAELSESALPTDG